MLDWSAQSRSAELDALIGRLQPDVLQVPCTAAARAIQAQYEQEAPRATGSMAVSAYVATPDESDYGARTAAADSVNPHVVILSEEPVPPAPGAVVGVAAAHADLIEHGSEGGRVAPRPTFTPAVEGERPRFPDRVQATVWGHG
jgi:hypothetical protein